MPTNRSLRRLTLLAALAAAFDQLHPLGDHPLNAASAVSASARVAGAEVTR